VQQLKETHSDQEQNETFKPLEQSECQQALSWPRLFCYIPVPCSVASRNHQLNRKQLCCALPAPSSGGDEDFASIGIFDFGSGGEAANIDITGVGRIRLITNPGLLAPELRREICSRPLRGHTGRNSSSHWFPAFSVASGSFSSGGLTSFRLTVVPLSPFD